jgi:hypothetical protein
MSEKTVKAILAREQAKAPPKKKTETKPESK